MNETDSSIQMTLFDYFMDFDQFTLKEATEAVLHVKEVKEPSIRGRIYEGIDKGLFERVGKGVYAVRREYAGRENSCLLINGDGRDLSMFEDNSFDALICDHPYKLDASLKGGNRNFAEYESFLYEQKDLNEKCRVLKPGCFLVEFLPEEQELIADGNLTVSEAAKDLICLVDHQGAYLGDIGRERYPVDMASVQMIVDRMDIYIQECIKEFQEALKVNDIDAEALSLEQMVEQCEALGVGNEEVNYPLAEAVIFPENIYIKEAECLCRIYSRLST